MNRYIKTIFLGFAILLATSSCNKDFLDLKPLDSNSPEVFYAKAENLETALYGVYDGVQGLFPQQYELDALGDNCVIESSTSGSNFRDFALGSHNPSTTGYIPNLYLRSYTVIQRANILLLNINAPGSITDAQRKTIGAEARFLRALAYQNLVYLFGDVPLVTEPISISDALKVTRTDRAKVVDFVLLELKQAADDLSTTPYGNNIVRATKQAALGLRARVLLYEARTGKKSWAEARTALAEAMTVAESAGATLVKVGNGLDGKANYESVFDVANENNKEILFAVKYNPTSSEGHLLHIDFGLKFLKADGGNNGLFSVYEEFVNSFDMSNGAPKTPVDLSNLASFDNRDPRLYATVYIPGYTFIPSANYYFNNKAVYGDRLSTPYSVRKWNSETLLGPDGTDYILLRYADILLQFAEAENEANGPSTEAYNAINRVRQRVNIPNITAGLSKDQFRLAVQNERRHELCFEGNRWFDLVQWKLANTVLNAIPGKKFVVGRNELLPIPQAEIDKNKALTQNPGYPN